MSSEGNALCHKDVMRHKFDAKLTWKVVHGSC
jgi:hypothetical protein